MHSVPKLSPTKPDVSNWWLPNFLQWSAIDEGTNGKVRFLTTVELSGEKLADLPESSLYRMACYYLLGHLDDKSIINAYETLTDIFSWQADRLLSAPSAPHQQRIPAGGLRDVERIPFTLEG